jgi:acyl carrier protein
VLKDVRDIIAEQLGKDLKEVRRSWPCLVPIADICPLYARHTLRSQSLHARVARPAQRHGARCQRLSVACAPQVTPEAKFVDMGADSLDTVRRVPLHNSADVQLLVGTMPWVHAFVPPCYPD